MDSSDLEQHYVVHPLRFEHVGYSFPELEPTNHLRSMIIIEINCKYVTSTDGRSSIGISTANVSSMISSDRSVHASYSVFQEQICHPFIPLHLFFLRSFEVVCLHKKHPTKATSNEKISASLQQKNLSPKE